MNVTQYQQSNNLFDHTSKLLTAACCESGSVVLSGHRCSRLVIDPLPAWNAQTCPTVQPRYITRICADVLCESAFNYSPCHKYCVAVIRPSEIKKLQLHLVHWRVLALAGKRKSFRLGRPNTQGRERRWPVDSPTTGGLPIDLIYTPDASPLTSFRGRGGDWWTQDNNKREHKRAWHESESSLRSTRYLWRSVQSRSVGSVCQLSEWRTLYERRSTSTTTSNSNRL